MQVHGPDDARLEDVTGLARFIREHQQEVLDEWKTLVRQLPSAQKLDQPALLDHVPDVLDRIADLADSIARGGQPDLPKAAAERHALDRLDDGFDLSEVVLEYALLRDCILRRWEAETVAPEVRGGTAILSKAMDRAIAASVDRYTHARNRTLQALDRISTAAFGSRNLDELLSQLLEVLVATTAAVDIAVILLRDADVFRVRATVGLEEKSALGFEVRVGEAFTDEDAADALAKSDFILAKRVRALYGAPLVGAGEIIGMAYIGSLTAYDFSDQDKRLLLAMANRATAAISQHLLRDAAETRASELAAEIERRREFETIASQHPDFMYLLDRDHRFTYANPAILALWEKRLEDVVGKNFAELGYPKNLVELHRRQIDDVLRGKTVRGESTYTSPSGYTGHYEYIMAPVLDPGDGVRAVAGTTRDITARRRADEEQRLLVRAAQDAVRARDDILAVVSHDLKNPLGAIHMASALLLKRLASDPRARKHLDVIHRSTETMDRLIGDLLDTASIQSKRLAIEKEVHDAELLVSEAVELHEPLAAEKAIEVRRELRFGGARICCDRERLLQVFANLLGNAIKFCGRGDRITVRAEVAASELRCAVSDTGPGMAEQELPHVFEPYWSAAGRYAKKGTGLGLFITKGIVEAHGGRIWVESEVGAGSNFWFALPLAQHEGS